MCRVVALNSRNAGRRVVYLPETVGGVYSEVSDPMVEHIEKLYAGCTADDDRSFKCEIRAVLAEGDQCGLASA